GCTDCPGDLIAAARDVALGTGLARLGGQAAIGAALAAAAWLAATLAATRTQPRRWLLSPRGVAAAAATGVALAVAARAWVTLPSGRPAPGLRAGAGGLLLGRVPARCLAPRDAP